MRDGGKANSSGVVSQHRACPRARLRQHRRGHRPRRGQGRRPGQWARRRHTTGTFGSVPAGDIVILALPYASEAPVVAQYGDALAGKVIVDISNPFDPAFTGLVAPVGSSGAQEIAKAAPAGARRQGLQHPFG